MTDSEIAMACDEWLEGTDVSNTIMEGHWPGRIFWPNNPTKPREDEVPRVEVAFLTTQPQQLGLLPGSAKRRFFAYVLTIVAPQYGYQYNAQSLADVLARRFMVGTQPGGTRELWVRMPPQTGPGFETETEWRLPVTISLVSATARDA